MGIFTTREIAIFVYAVVLVIYLIIHKKVKSILLPVIKAACHIKLIIPLLIVLFFAIVFTKMCTYLPFWRWEYIKDISFWVVFAGVPVCFNAVSNEIEENYFKNIIFNNLKFTALVEFLTGTFTFHIVFELLLQPILLIFTILQSSHIDKSERVKRIIDNAVGILGLIIILFTIKSAVDSIGSVKFIDIIIGLMLPLILSSLYLPIAYFFAVYAKYETVFMRMGFRETDDRKLKVKHRIEVICCCKLSYKKVCKFLKEYVPKMYIRMSNDEFENIINEFKDV